MQLLNIEYLAVYALNHLTDIKMNRDKNIHDPSS